MLLNFFSQIQAHHSAQSARLWLSGILKILFVEQWTVQILCSTFWTPSLTLWIVFLVSKYCKIYVRWRLERFCLYKFLLLPKQVLYLVSATQVYPWSFSFSDEWVRLFDLYICFQHYTHSKALALHLISDLDLVSSRSLYGKKRLGLWVVNKT